MGSFLSISVLLEGAAVGLSDALKGEKVTCPDETIPVMESSYKVVRLHRSTAKFPISLSNKYLLSTYH